jgi:hypothetical protein
MSELNDNEISALCSTRTPGDQMAIAACIEGQIALRDAPKLAQRVQEAQLTEKIAEVPASVPIDREATTWLNNDSNIKRASKKEVMDMCTRAFPQAVDECIAKVDGRRKQFTEEIKPISKEVDLAPIVGYSGFCEEGSVCATPVYGRPAWFWVLLVIVILLASAAFKKG